MLSWLAFPLVATLALAVPLDERQSGPSVEIDDGTVVGSTSGGVDSFKGIPYAEPPTGTNRLRVPSALAQPFGTIQATGVPTACPPLVVDESSALVGLADDAIDLVLQTPLFETIAPIGEDCLTVNVQRPEGTTAEDNLPVMFWIFGGGFLLGSTSMYDGSSFIERSVALGEPMIYVSVNYRVAGFGFLAGQELAAEGNTNLGLRDQRLGMQWVQDNIAAFGGDPSKVTLWGESAGAISAFDHTLINGGDNTGDNGDALFRGVIMNSGSIVPAKEVTSEKPQAIYDQVVAAAGCSGSDTLECLRGLDFNSFQDAANSVPGIFSYSSLDLSYLPRPDSGDNFFSESPEISVQRGAFTKVPIIIGDQEDEGTLFSLVQFNVTSEADLVEYLTSYFPDSASDVQSLVDTYDDRIIAGSPFNTGIVNEIRPEFKRLAAILGDIVFTLTRRVYLDLVADQVPAWSYLSTYFYGTPVLGTFHGSDLLRAYALLGSNNVPTTSIQTYYINFVNSLDPNDGPTPAPLIDWPNWSSSSPNLLNFRQSSNGIIQDNFRQDSYDFLRGSVEALRI